MHFGSKACVSHVQNQNRSKLRTFHRYCEPQAPKGTAHAVADGAPPAADARPELCAWIESAGTAGTLGRAGLAKLAKLAIFRNF